MIRDFIAIDFETANQQPSSVCSIGVVMVRNGQVADSFYSLIQPEPNHGLSQCDTDDAPVFSKVWQQLEEKIADVFFSDLQTIDDIHYQIATIPFVAHNARFDEGCLKAVFRVYQMDYPDYRFYDPTVRSFAAQSSAPHCCSRLWLRPSESSSCPGRCRSLCRNSFIYSIKKSPKFN